MLLIISLLNSFLYIIRFEKDLSSIFSNFLCFFYLRNFTIAILLISFKALSLTSLSIFLIIEFIIILILNYKFLDKKILLNLVIIVCILIFFLIVRLFIFNETNLKLPIIFMTRDILVMALDWAQSYKNNIFPVHNSNYTQLLPLNYAVINIMTGENNFVVSKYFNDLIVVSIFIYFFINSKLKISNKFFISSIILSFFYFNEHHLIFSGLSEFQAISFFIFGYFCQKKNGLNFQTILFYFVSLMIKPIFAIAILINLFPYLWKINLKNIKLIFSLFLLIILWYLIYYYNLSDPLSSTNFYYLVTNEDLYNNSFSYLRFIDSINLFFEWFYIPKIINIDFLFLFLVLLYFFFILISFNIFNISFININKEIIIQLFLNFIIWALFFSYDIRNSLPAILFLTLFLSNSIYYLNINFKKNS